ERLRVVRDDREMVPAELGVALPVDPGEHVVRASAPGKRDWETRFRIEADAQRVSIEVPELEDAPSSPVALAPAPALAPPRELVPAPPSAPPTAPPSGAGNAQRTVAAVALGAGVVAAAIGTYAGIRAITSAADARHGCDNHGCDPQGSAASDDS